jgi:photosystem II stability/assembly factor-like uncharacterized protein
MDRSHNRGSSNYRLWLTSVSLFVMLFVLAACSSGSGGATNPTPGVTATTTTTSAATASPTPAGAASGSTEAPTKPKVPLIDIRMLDRMNGWALTKTQILKTADGGLHWKDVTPSASPITSKAVGRFMDANHAWVVNALESGDSVTIRRTIDGGQSWQATTISSIGPNVIDPPHFVNTQEGWLEIVGSPGAGNEQAEIWHSTDGGLHWSRIYTTAQPGKYLTNEGFKSGLSFKDALNGWATLSSDTGNSLNSGLYVTHDGGKSWMRQAIPEPQNIDAIGTTPPVIFGKTAILPAYLSANGQQKLLLYVSHDGGESWAPTTLVALQAGNVYVIDPSHIWATEVQTGQFFYTSDGGKTWQHSASGPGKIQAMSFNDPANGWAVTESSLLHMTNGGPWNVINYSIQ